MKNKCNKCGECCKTGYDEFCVIIYPRDVISISKQLGINSIDFLQLYCIRFTINIGEKQIETYRLKTQNNACVFLNNNLCDIYSFRPTQCMLAPYNYFSKYEIWKHMPCVNKGIIEKSNSQESDQELVEELLKGYYA